MQCIEEEAHRLAAADRFSSAAETLLPVALDDPQNARRWLNLAHWQRTSGDFDGAARTLRLALHLNEKCPAATRRKIGTDVLTERRVCLLQALAETHLEDRDWGGCVTACRQLLEKRPQNHWALELAATSMLQMGSLDEATSVVRRLLQLSPDDPLHRLRLATLLQLQGLLGDACRQFQLVAVMHSHMPFHQEALEAIEALDKMQTQQVLMLASEQTDFRLRLERSFDEALAESAFHLSDHATETLRHMVWDGRLEAPFDEDGSDSPAMRIH